MTDTPTLAERYVDAALRTVPEAQRDDIGAELRASIADQIDGRIASGEPHADAERAVLTDLGDPEALAARYTERPLRLIGPRFYLTWWRLLKLLWAIVPVCAAFGVALGLTLSGAPFGEIVGTVIGVTISVVVQIGFWVTLVFHFVERDARGSADGIITPWTPDRLPEVRESGAKLSDLIANLVWLCTAAALLLWDHFVGAAYLEAGGGWVSLLAADLWPWWIGALFALMLLEALLAITVFARGGWSMPLAAVNAALNLAIAAPIVWLLADDRVFNPEFFPMLIPHDAATVAPILTIIVGFAVVGVAVGDSVDAVLKARRRH